LIRHETHANPISLGVATHADRSSRRIDQTRLIQILLGLSLLLNTFVLAGFIYRSWIVPPFDMHEMPPPPRGAPGVPGQPGGPRPNPVEMVVRDLDLDAGQRKVMQDLFDEYAKERRERLQAIARLREQTAVEFSRKPLDMAKVDALVIGVVPMSPSLASLGPDADPKESIAAAESLARTLPALFAETKKPIVAVVDAGRIYDPLVKALENGGLPVFRRADEAVMALGAWIGG